jgi:hypothetical protein
MHHPAKRDATPQPRRAPERNSRDLAFDTRRELPFHEPHNNCSLKRKKREEAT